MGFRFYKSGNMLRNDRDLICLYDKAGVVVLGFYVPATAKVIRRRGLGLKSHPKDYTTKG